MGNQSRYFIKFRVSNHPGHFWTEYRCWDTESKSLKTIFADVLHHCKDDAQKILKEKFKDEDIDITSFNLVETTIKLEV
jgi:hypothetical protein